MERYGHVLVIGGTGMLAEAARALAVRCEMLTLVARTEASLRALDGTLEGTECVRHLLSLDWSDAAVFLGALGEHVDQVVRPDLVVAWLHEDNLGPAIAGAIASTPAGCDFVQVRGSRAAAPTADATALARDRRIPPDVRYRQVILGFVVVDDRSRWLTHTEISEGVLRAIDDTRSLTIVGTVEPWERRP
ncbi:MAG: hypothetical protein DWG83_01480 [Chloroflexi bacterium]|nr:hypothetical protein [Chloroflexota bacterium]MDA1239615.1 hypothetical protein [Chloroflexota bacterium]MQC19227.1 hypothetical protein [Chloroflexota bacterium]